MADRAPLFAAALLTISGAAAATTFIFVFRRPIELPCCPVRETACGTPSHAFINAEQHGEFQCEQSRRNYLFARRLFSRTRPDAALDKESNDAWLGFDVPGGGTDCRGSGFWRNRRSVD